MYYAIAANKRKTVLMFINFALIILAIGATFSVLLGSWHVIWITSAIAAIYVAPQLYSARKLVLLFYKARPITQSEEPRFYRTVENLAITNGMPMPSLYVITDSSPNALTAGFNPKNSSIAATTGLLELMNDSELDAVMAHQMAHIQNYDVRLMTAAYALNGFINFIAELCLWVLPSGAGFRLLMRNPLGWLLLVVMAITAPIGAGLTQMSLIRSRQFLADVTAVETTRYPEALISALTKMGNRGTIMDQQNTASSHMFFADPRDRWFRFKFLDSHPTIAKRIERLERIYQPAGSEPKPLENSQPLYY